MWDRRHPGATRIRECLVHWLIRVPPPPPPSCLLSHNACYSVFKSLILNYFVVSNVLISMALDDENVGHMVTITVIWWQQWNQSVTTQHLKYISYTFEVVMLLISTSTIIWNSTAWNVEVLDSTFVMVMAWDVRQHAILRSDLDPDLCWYMASLAHNEITH